MKYNYFSFCYYFYKSKKLECQEKKIILEFKKKSNVHNNEKNVNKKIIFQDDEYDDNIYLDEVD